MAKKEAAKPTVTKQKIEGPARKKRSSLRRKCLDRAAKIMFGGAGHAVFRILEKVKDVPGTPLGATRASLGLE